MNKRACIIYSHIHPISINLIDEQLCISTTSTTARPQLHGFDLKQIIQYFNAGEHIKLVSKLGSSYYNVNHENIISKLYDNGCLSITLNRVKNFNALSYDMVVDLFMLLAAAISDEGVKFIVLSSNSPVAYCAGGDIKALTSDPNLYAANFLGVEFNLNLLLSRIDKPVVALLNGITMGGGVGISVYASYRVVRQDKFVFAMPETGIGLLTDIGAGYFLPRLAPSIALANYVGIIGARLDAKDALYYNFATHVVTPEDFAKLKEQLQHVRVNNYAFETRKTHAIIKELLDRVHIPDDQGKLASMREWIDSTFDEPSVEKIVENLKKTTNSQEEDEWRQKTLREMLTKSPTSIKITFETIKRGNNGATLQEVLRTDFRVATKLVKSNDFREGVRAVVVEKKNDPKWSPAKLEDVDENYVKEIFDEPVEHELQFFK